MKHFVIILLIFAAGTALTIIAKCIFANDIVYAIIAGLTGGSVATYAAAHNYFRKTK